MMLSRRDKLFLISLLPFSLSVLAVLVILLFTVVANSLDALKVFCIQLLTSSVWDPENKVYGVLAPIIGSLTTSLIAVLTALVLSILLAILIAEYLRGFSREILSSIVEFTGGLPTIIFAIWASQYLVPFLRDAVMMPLHSYLSFISIFSCRPVTGFSVFSAGIALGISIVPYVTSIILEAYQSIPVAYREACYGIGATKYESIRILLSLARPAVVAALILGFARSLGETTIVVATIGNSMNLTPCIFAPGYTVSALIASQFGNAYLYPYAESVLYFSMFIVAVISLVLSLYASSVIIKWRSRIVV